MKFTMLLAATVSFVALAPFGGSAQATHVKQLSSRGVQYWICHPGTCNNKGGTTAWQPSSCKPRPICDGRGPRR